MHDIVLTVYSSILMKHDIKHAVHCSLARSLDHYVSHQNTYIAYQLLITTTILITIKESYLTISKIVSHFIHGQNRAMKN